MRDTYVDRGGLAAFVGSVAPVVSCRLRLRSFDRDDVVAFVARVSGRKVDDDMVAMAESLFAETNGNPLFLREMTRRIDEPAAPGGAKLSDSIGDIVHLRLRSLRARDALAVASVIGQEFTADVLAAATGIDPADLLDSLDESCRAGILYQGDAGERFGFSHALVRRTLLDSVGQARRAVFHRRIAEALEHRHPAARPAELAHHFAGAGTTECAIKAITYGQAAGAAAMESSAFEAAVEQFSRARALAEAKQPDDLELRCSLLLDLGAAYDKVGDYNGRESSFLAAAELARLLARADFLVMAALGYGGVPAGPDPDARGRALLEEALARLGPEPSRDRAFVMGRLAQRMGFTPPRSRRVALAGEAVAIAREVGDARDLAEVLIHQCWALDGPDDLDAQIDLAQEVQNIGEAVGDGELVVRALHCRTDALFEAGAVEELRSGIADIAALAEKLRYREYIRVGLGWEAVFAGIEGRYDDATRLTAEVNNVMEAMAHPQREFVVAGLTLPIIWMQGRLGEVRSQFEALAATVTGPAPVPDMVLAWCHAESGDLELARAALTGIDMDAVATLDHNFTWWTGVVALISTVTILRDRDWAAVLYDMVLPYRDRFCSVGSSAFVGAAEHHLGALATTIGDWEAAADHFERALATHTALGSPPFVALTEISYAAALDGRGGPGDAARAAELRTHALAVASELGLGAVTFRDSQTR
jgi:tetratricopeptide (TPR) repeat protein